MSSESTSSVRWSVSALMSSSVSLCSAIVEFWVALEVLDAAPDDGQRGAQLMAGVGRELALALERFADRDEGPPGIQGAADHRQAKGGQAPDQEDIEELLEGLGLGRPVGDDLDHVGLAGHDDRLADELDRGTLDRGLADVDPAKPGSRDGGHVGQVVVAGVLGPERLVARSDDHGQGARRRAAEGQAGRQARAEPGRLAGGVVDHVDDLVGPAPEPLVDAVGQGSIDGQVDHRPEDDQDQQGDPAAPQDQPAPRPAQKPGVAGGSRRRPAGAHLGAGLMRPPSGSRSRARFGSGFRRSCRAFRAAGGRRPRPCSGSPPGRRARRRRGGCPG